MTRFIVTAILLVLASLPAQAQTQRFYDAQGRSTGTATTDSQGTTRFYDERGRSTGSATPDSQGTTRFYDKRGRSTGTITGPAPHNGGGKR